MRSERGQRGTPAGLLIAAGLLVGAGAGIARGQASLGAVIGFGVGILLALAFVLLKRRRR